jgi:hypothetical protein
VKTGRIVARSLAVCGVLLACAAGGAPARAEGPGGAAGHAESAGPAPAKGADEARALFEQGVAAHDAGKLDEAESLFSRAWAKKRSWDIAANLGIVLKKRGQPVRAAEYLSFALSSLPPSESDGTREGIARALAAVSPLVGRLTIRSNVEGAEVRVAGHHRGVTPLEGPVFMAPGIVLVEVKKDGYEPALSYVRAGAGSTVEVTVALRPSPPGEERSLAAPLVAFGVGGAGLVTGAVAAGVAAVKLSELKGVCGPDLVCPPGARGDAEAGRTAGHVATVGFAIAGLGAAVGLTLLAIPTGKSSTRVGLTVGPTFVGLKGAF